MVIQINENCEVLLKTYRADAEYEELTPETANPETARSLPEEGKASAA
jgi:hypothetical protein